MESSRSATATWRPYRGRDPIPTIEGGATFVQELANARRAVFRRIAGGSRYVPVEYAARYRDALEFRSAWTRGCIRPACSDPLLELARRYCRTHGPFTTAENRSQVRTRTGGG